MSRLNVMKVEWISDEEVQMHVPDVGTWKATAKRAVTDNEVWLLTDHHDQEDGYFDTGEEAIAAVCEEYEEDGLTAVVTRDDR